MFCALKSIVPPTWLLDKTQQMYQEEGSKISCHLGPSPPMLGTILQIRVLQSKGTGVYRAGLFLLVPRDKLESSPCIDVQTPESISFIINFVTCVPNFYLLSSCLHVCSVCFGFLQHTQESGLTTFLISNLP